MPTPRVSIVMTYHERLGQLRNTLRSFVLHGYRDLEVVVVDDASVREPLSEAMFADLPFPVRVVSMSEPKGYTNPCIPFNRGIRTSTGDLVVLQNAECAHVDDVLGHLRGNVTDRNYLSYACYSVNETKTRALIDAAGDWRLDDLRRLVQDDRVARFDGDDAWYNHGIHRPVAYHYCSAMTRGALDRLGGFDERYATGIAWDDDEFLARIRRLPLDVRIVDDHVVLHQWHYGSTRRADHDYRFARNAVLLRLVTRREKAILPSPTSPRYVAAQLLMPLLVAAWRARSRLLEARKR